jgi:hypothetical protein
MDVNYNYSDILRDIVSSSVIAYVSRFSDGLQIDAVAKVVTVIFMPYDSSLILISKGYLVLDE